MKEKKYTKSLAKNQVCAILYMQDIRENVLTKCAKLCMKTPSWCPFEGTNVAAKNQQKHLSLSLPTKA